jgi:hypothetical protein
VSRELAPRPRDEEVARVAIALKGLLENTQKSWKELLREACRLLLSCHEVVEAEHTKYALRFNRERSVELRPVSDEEAALFFMPREKDSDLRLERLHEFKDFLQNPVELLGDLSLGYILHVHTGEIRSGNWTYGLCVELKRYFPKWKSIKASRAQKLAKES